MSKIQSDSVCVFIGKRRSGKSFLIRDLLFHHRDIPIGTVISGTESMNKFYGNLIPSLFIHHDYNPMIVKNALERQKTVIRQNIRDTRAFLLLDDCQHVKSWIREKTTLELFMNGRHYNLLFILAMQYVLGITPELRGNIDYTFILKANNISDKKKIYINYAGVFPTFEMFRQVMNQCTENYECLVIDNTSLSSKTEDQVFWYKADDHPNFRIGMPEFWEYHNINYNDSDDENNDFAMDQLRRRGPIFNVKKIF
tara:strand:+ start:436 stop:1197 length:762 start_codon:yes stop_codon:yes gene_type:complete